MAALEYLHAGGVAPAPFGSSLDRRAVLGATGAVEADDADEAAEIELPLVVELPVIGHVPPPWTEREAS